MSNNLSPKLKLLKLLTLSSSIILEDNSPLNSLISNCSEEEIKKLIKLKIPEKFLLFYLNNEIINDYLYKVDDVQFDLENFQNNFLNYFYLDLLIAFNKDYVIYMYEIETIQYLNNQEIKGKTFLIGSETSSEHLKFSHSGWLSLVLFSELSKFIWKIFWFSPLISREEICGRVSSILYIMIFKHVYI